MFDTKIEIVKILTLFGYRWVLHFRRCYRMASTEYFYWNQDADIWGRERYATKFKTEAAAALALLSINQD